MKNSILKIKYVLILTLLVFATSCGSDDDPQQQGETNFMSAKIDGEDFFSDFPIYLASTAQVITVSGQDTQGIINIQISIFDYNGPGTYSIDTNTTNENGMIIINNEGVFLTNQNNGSGTVTFIKEGKFLKATFSFNAVKELDGTTVDVTAGEFNVQIEL